MTLEEQIKSLRDQLSAAQAEARDLQQRSDSACGNVKRLEHELEQTQARCRELEEALR